MKNKSFVNISINYNKTANINMLAFALNSILEKLGFPYNFPK